VGRLDVLTAVNQRALAHYAGQDLERLPAESLERRARILHAMGEDDMKRGDMDRALAQFQEARRTTGALLAADSDNPDRLWAHGQSAFWVGYVDLERKRPQAAKQAFLEYQHLSERLATLAPGNAVYLREAGYAQGSLCSAALTKPREVQLALRSCSAALERIQSLTTRTDRPERIEHDLAERHAWMADAYAAAAKLDRASEHRAAQEVILTRLISAAPEDVTLRQKLLALQRSQAAIDHRRGRIAEAQRGLARAKETASQLVALDPENRKWAQQLQRIEKSAAYLGRTTSRPAGAD
jgi:tetratricopeptide (TPR) repeat protein